MFALTALAVGVLGALTGCGDDPTDSESTSAGGHASTPKASATATATPTATAAPVAATCQNLIDPATLAGFASHGLAITPSADFGAKMASEGNYLSGFVAAGGLLCQVGPTGGVEASELYAWAPFVEADTIPVQSGLTSEGWSVAATSAGALYSLGSGNEQIIFRCLFNDTEMACAVNDARLAEVLAHAPH
jgi:hypothetical protein